MRTYKPFRPTETPRPNGFPLIQLRNDRKSIRRGPIKLYTAYLTNYPAGEESGRPFVLTKPIWLIGAPPSRPIDSAHARQQSAALLLPLDRKLWGTHWNIRRTEPATHFIISLGSAGFRLWNAWRLVSRRALRKPRWFGVEFFKSSPNTLVHVFTVLCAS